MGEHIDSRKKASKRKKGNLNEGSDYGRRQRVSFKNFVRDLDEELLDEELEDVEDEQDEENGYS